MIVNSIAPSFTSPVTNIEGEMRYDINSSQMLVFNGINWDGVQQHITTDFNSDEIERIRRFLTNIDKYEKILKEHYPEDYL